MGAAHSSNECGTRRKSSPFRSAMSMLTFCSNRKGGRPLSDQLGWIDEAKDELRELSGRTEKGRKA